MRFLSFAFFMVWGLLQPLNRLLRHSMYPAPVKCLWLFQRKALLVAVSGSTYEYGRYALSHNKPRRDCGLVWGSSQLTGTSTVRRS